MGLDTQPYVYANNNPISHVDPMGMRPFLEEGLAPGMDGYAQAIRDSHSAMKMTPQGTGNGGGLRYTAPARTCSVPGTHPTCAQIDLARSKVVAAQDDFGTFFGLGTKLLGIVRGLAGSIQRLTVPVVPGILTFLLGAGAAYVLWDVVTSLATVAVGVRSTRFFLGK